MSLSLPPYLEQWSKASENLIYLAFIGVQGQEDSLGSIQVLGIMVDVAGLAKEPEIVIRKQEEMTTPFN